LIVRIIHGMNKKRERERQRRERRERVSNLSLPSFTNVRE
jgi:hypothetical protein